MTKRADWTKSAAGASIPSKKFSEVAEDVRQFVFQKGALLFQNQTHTFSRELLAMLVEKHGLCPVAEEPCVRVESPCTPEPTPKKV